jgi:glycosyltransferase involved in cell wall biosynthesis
MTPFVSIITPSLNSEKTIQNAINSVIDQNYLPVEHIIIDGGSTDETIAILKKSPTSIWISEPDKGIYDAMNKGIKMAKGNWIYFLGSDDVLMPGVLNKIFGCANNNANSDLIYGNVIFSSNGQIYDGEFSIQKLLIRNISHQAIFYKKSLLQKMGSFNIQYTLWADYALNIKLFSLNTRMQYIDECIALYNHNGISSRNVDLSFIKDCRNIFFNGFSAFIPKKEIAKSLVPYMYEMLKAKKTISAFFLLCHITFYVKSLGPTKDFFHIICKNGKA